MVTSVADILAGIAIACTLHFTFSQTWPAVLLLCFSTACLYGGGIVFNDVFDADLDRIERPERAIPSGRIQLKEAAVLGSLLLGLGIIAAALNSTTSGFMALSIAVAALVYDKWAKHHPFFGPLTMGICRGLNLLLGISILPGAITSWYFLAIAPIAYIFSITMTSRGEVHGGNKTNLYTAAFLYAAVISFISYFSYTNGRLLWSLVFLLPFTWMIFKPLFKAIQQPIGKNIGMAVKAGVLSLILMDASWAVTFSSIYTALFIACFLPVSVWLSKFFAVT